MTLGKLHFIMHVGEFSLCIEYTLIMQAYIYVQVKVVAANMVT